MIDRFTYSNPPTRVLFGGGTVGEIRAEAFRAGMSRVLILCSKGRREFADSVAGLLGDMNVGICDAAVPNMPQEAFDVVCKQLQATKADSFVALGGGSAIGLAKSVAASTRFPFIGVITTLSGSEMSSRWALGRGLGRKAGDDQRALPTVAIYDPDLIQGLPPRVMAASGMNAVAHAVESLYGEDTNPVVQTLAEDAIARLAGYLSQAVADPGNAGARSEALYGAWLAASFRSAICIHHVIAQQVRQLFDLDHAQTHAAVLPYALAFNAPAIPAAMEKLRRALKTDDPPGAIYELNKAMGLPASLAAIGMPAERLGDAVDVVMKVKGYNPRPYTSADVTTILEQALAGAPPRTEG
jgi:maleylacetate reductase